MKHTIEVRDTHEGWKATLRDKTTESYYGPEEKLAVLLDKIAIKIIKRTRS